MANEPTIDTIIRQIGGGLDPKFEEKLRGFLATQDKDWLIDQIVHYALDAQESHEMKQIQLQEPKTKKCTEIVARLREIGLNDQVLVAFLERYQGHDRAKLITNGYIVGQAPMKGASLIGEEHRTSEGKDLLLDSKAILFGLLFGDDKTHTHFDRIERELLTLTLPRCKADALDFMKASVELSGLGTWQDPDNVSHDEDADNVILEIEYGEIEGELIGKGIARSLSLINNLEVNEQVLYARMINVEQSTLIE